MPPVASRGWGPGSAVLESRSMAQSIRRHGRESGLAQNPRGGEGAIGARAGGRGALGQGGSGYPYNRFKVSMIDSPRSSVSE